MKILVAVYAADDRMLLQTLKQYNGLMDSCADAEVDVDTYLYTDERVSEYLLREHFENKLFFDRNPIITAEGIAKRLVQLAKEEQYDGIILLESTLSNDIVGIAAARLIWGYVTSVSEIRWEAGRPRCNRFVYNNNIKAEIQLQSGPFIISLSIIRYKEHKSRVKKQLQLVTLKPFPCPEYIVSHKRLNARKEDADSQILIVAGRGVKTKAAIDEIRQFSKSQGYSFGVTRPVAMNAWGRIDEIIGVSGSVYAPKVCIAIGVSGAAAFYAGIESSECIVSINTDTKAPIIGMSDVSIVEDYENLLKKLFTMLERGKYGTK